MLILICVNFYGRKVYDFDVKTLVTLLSYNGTLSHVGDKLVPSSRQVH